MPEVRHARYFFGAMVFIHIRCHNMRHAAGSCCLAHAPLLHTPLWLLLAARVR